MQLISSGGCTLDGRMVRSPRWWSGKSRPIRFRCRWRCGGAEVVMCMVVESCKRVWEKSKNCLLIYYQGEAGVITSETCNHAPHCLSLPLLHSPSKNQNQIWWVLPLYVTLHLHTPFHARIFVCIEVTGILLKACYYLVLPFSPSTPRESRGPCCAQSAKRISFYLTIFLSNYFCISRHFLLLSPFLPSRTQRPRDR